MRWTIRFRRASGTIETTIREGRSSKEGRSPGTKRMRRYTSECTTGSEAQKRRTCRSELEEFETDVEAKSGERGVVNRENKAGIE